MDSAEKCIFSTQKVLFAGDEHKFAVHEHMFADGEHKFTEQEHKILKCMANFVLQELPDEMTDGKKIVYLSVQRNRPRCAYLLLSADCAFFALAAIFF